MGAEPDVPGGGRDHPRAGGRVRQYRGAGLVWRCLPRPWWSFVTAYEEPTLRGPMAPRTTPTAAPCPRGGRASRHGMEQAARRSPTRLIGSVSVGRVARERRPLTDTMSACRPRHVIGHSFRRGTSPVHRRECSPGPPCSACCAPRDTSGSRPPARRERHISSSSGAPGSTTPSTSREATGPGGRATSRVTRGSPSGCRLAIGPRTARRWWTSREVSSAPSLPGSRANTRRSTGGLRLSAARGAVRERTNLPSAPDEAHRLRRAAVQHLGDAFHLPASGGGGVCRRPLTRSHVALDRCLGSSAQLMRVRSAVRHRSRRRGG